MKWSKTRFPELGYADTGHGVWRIIDTDGGCAVGPFYATKAELLANLESYAVDFGCAVPRRQDELVKALEFTLNSIENRKKGLLTPAKDGSDWATVENVIREALKGKGTA